MNTDAIQRTWRGIDLGTDVHPYEAEMFPILVDLAMQAERILEIGVGRGRMVRLLRSRRVGSQIIGLDLIQEGVRGIPGIGVMGDSRRLPFADGTFDIAYSLGVVEHFPETAQAVREHARVVKPGGHVLISAPHLGPATPARWLVYWLLQRRKFKVSFEVLLGRNLSLRRMRRDCRAAHLDIVRLTASGPVIPSAHPGLQKIFDRIPLPRERYGAYLWCLARKQAPEVRPADSRRDQPPVG
jgi:SAM-dependent methyltransferase